MHLKKRKSVIENDLAWIASANLPWEKLAGKTVFVSGGSGFLPAYLVETILFLNETVNSGCPSKVIALVRNEGRARDRFAAYEGREELSFLVQDVCSALNVSDTVDFIIHAASQASPKYYGIDPVGTLSANVFGTQNLLNLAKDKKVESFLFFSSGEIYGNLDSSQVPTREDVYGVVDPMNVRSCYAESKRLGETMCVTWAQQFGVPARVVRPFHTFGPGMTLDDGRVFADFVSDVVHRRNIVMKSDGSARRPFCYLADATVGFLTVLLKGQTGEAYNVGNDLGELSILEFAHMAANLDPSRQLKVVLNESAAAPEYLKSPIIRNCPDISKIRQLGWEPITAVDEGLRRTIQYYL